MANIKSDGTILSSFDYLYDNLSRSLGNVGNRTQVTEANGDIVTWSYDSIYQLTRERRSGSNSYDTTFTYDAVGNRTTKLTAAGTTTYAYDNANRIQSETAPDQTITTYSFDSKGNLTEKNANGTRTTYTWDTDNRMTRITFSDNSTNSFSYDGDGLRRAATDKNSVITKFIWDGQRVLLETNDGGTTQVTYTLSDDQYGDLLSQRRSDTSKFYLYDGLGSTDRLLAADETVTDNYVYYAFGELKSSTGSTTNPYKFVGSLGYYADADSGLHYLRARYYEAVIGRLLSGDPLRTVPNWYAYFQPVNAVDPAGLQAISPEAGWETDQRWGVIRGPVHAAELRVGFVGGFFRDLLDRWTKRAKKRVPPQQPAPPDLAVLTWQPARRSFAACESAYRGGLTEGLNKDAQATLVDCLKKTPPPLTPEAVRACLSKNLGKKEWNRVKKVAAKIGCCFVGRGETFEKDVVNPCDNGYLERCPGNCLNCAEFNTCVEQASAPTAWLAPAQKRTYDIEFQKCWLKHPS